MASLHVDPYFDRDVDLLKLVEFPFFCRIDCPGSILVANTVASPLLDRCSAFDQEVKRIEQGSWVKARNLSNSY
jgi:hypothetical protein